MNIFYCDDCGSVTEQNNGPENGGMMCRQCAGIPEPEAQPKSGLDLLDEPPSSIDDATLGKGPSLDSGELDLFSSQTIARRREKPKPRTETTLRLIEENPADAPGGLPPENETDTPPATAASPMSTPRQDERWCIDCLSCDGSLSIQPVDQKSRMRCPRCQATMVIEASGQVSLPVAPPQTPEQVAHFKVTAPPPAPPAKVQASPPQEQASGEQKDSVPLPTTFEEIFSSFETPVEPASSASSDTGTSVAATENSSVESSASTLTVDNQIVLDDRVVDEALLDEPLIDEGLFDSATSQEPHPETSDQGLADALLGSTFEDSREPSESSLETPASAVTIALWVTLAALPALVAVLLSHQELTAASATLCREIGTMVEENSGQFLNWLSTLLAG